MRPFVRNTSCSKTGERILLLFVAVLICITLFTLIYTPSKTMYIPQQIDALHDCRNSSEVSRPKCREPAPCPTVIAPVCVAIATSLPTNTPSAIDNSQNEVHHQCQWDKFSRHDQLRLFKQFALVLPPKPEVPYLLNDITRTFYSQDGQDAKVAELLQYMRGGFFVEAGAYDGESLSNTLYFEKTLGWTGLLVEANPRAYRELLNKDRHAWVTPSCLSVTKQMERISFLADGMVGGIQGFIKKLQVDVSNPYVYEVNVTCFPLDMMLDAIGVQTVDFFSLDIEGSEAAVLRNFPFERVEVGVLSIEVNGLPSDLDAILLPHGYRRVDASLLDVYYAKESYMKRKGLW